jgi:uncharacterized membrane protein SpoIIM required for sporulation
MSSAGAAGRTGGIGAFVRRRRAGWERLEVLSGRVEGGKLSLAEVEELDRLYRRTVGDLSYARGAFPGSDAEGYLSQVTGRAYGALYRKRAGSGAFRRFWLSEVPSVFRRHLPLFGLAALFLAAGVAAGALAIAADPAAATALVPPAVLRAVAARRMWTDSLLTLGPGLGGAFIARNNVAVTGLAFLLGLTGGIGTAWLLFANGLLLGAVAAHCLRNGMGAPLLSFAAAHGPAELACLLLAGQAGFLLARALVDPGEWPRGEALRLRAREASRLVALAAPLLAVVATVESTISPAAFSLAAKAILGSGLAAALLLYLWRLGARGPQEAQA